MANRKEHPRYHVISLRISDEDKTALEELTRCSCQTVSHLMREAMQQYVPMAANNGQG